MTKATVLAKNQILVPGKALWLKAGDKTLVVCGERTIVLQNPKSYQGAIRGLGRELYSSSHIQKERKAWK